MKFYELTYSDDEGLLSVEDYDLNGFDISSYWDGDYGSLEEISKVDFSFHQSGFKKSDLIGNPLGLILISEKAYEKLRLLVKNQSIFSKVSLLNLDSSEKELFYILTPVNTLNCLEMNLTEFLDEETVITPVLDSKKVSPDSLIFKVDGCTNIVVINELVMNSIKENKLDGFDFIELKVDSSES
ncbi:imm11 family protein [Pseudoalteromonas luteoviolacea]|uniref:Immunity MXAN-0049 protein domain-containing protein n=1 Tax=Pseudoalteromonas luteoviolacea DSM 6061 TaxID=1365250 RepID=A0A166V0I7_9GAMM|nr:DUF1629 domain-containing protein [Pseudoalteromonas luteoviolacea]KZN31595.1 hypothetical protein N475_23115 [Pseudoalteromonas luteoviolacea DSM 6061]MBE0389473.1 hypothetical protein [Pseudoalteromonas luteoviolacea DSM 6061]